MSNADAAHQTLHVLLMKDVADEAVALAEMHAVAVAGDHSRCVLTAVLKHRESVVELLIDALRANDPNYSAHVFSAPLTNIFEYVLGPAHQFEHVLLELEQRG